jgi:alkanesulfonate monooxygenase SsuD/methylene tetrahydromethanopterin reductase-like flavin-dependent oxidoreductase (luciferase family)
MPFVFAHHFHPHFTEPALQIYREGFKPSEMLERPRVIVAAGVIVGADDEHAARLALTSGVSMLRLRQGRPIPVPTIEEAEALLPRLSPEERTVVDETAARAIVGGPATVHSGLLDLIERTRTDELMITSNAGDLDVRLRALESVAQSFGLVPEGRAAA